MLLNGNGRRSLLARCGQFASHLRIRITGLRLVAVGALILYLILPAMLRYEELEKAQSLFVKKVKQLGGSVVVAPTGTGDAPPPLLTVDLGQRPIEGDFMKRLSAFTTIQRLNLDGARLASDDYRAIRQLIALRGLSLAESNVSDTDLSWSGLPLVTLSLRNTSLTDAGLSRLADTTSLVNLEINGTAVTAAGLPSLQKLSSLKALDLDDSCITDDGVLALQAVKSLENIRIHVADGFGRQTKELVSRLAGSATVQGINPSGLALWNAADAWDETLAGVVEIVAREVELDPQQLTQLIAAIGARGVGRPRQVTNQYRGPAQPQRTVESIDSTADFLRRLQYPQRPPYEVCAFARDRFSKDDIQQLLDAMHPVTNPQAAENLWRYGAYLLVRDGLENPNAVRKLDEMLTNETSWFRSIAVYGFSRYGHPFLDDWAPSESAVEFGLPRLIRLANDPAQTVRMAVSEVLGDLARHHPKRGPEVMPVLVQMLEQGDFHYVSYSIKQIVEVNPQAGRVHIPELRRLFKKNPRGNTNHQIVEVLCELARGDSAQAHEIAVDCLEMVRDGVYAGRHLVRLITPENSEAVRAIVRGLLESSASDDRRIAELSQDTLVAVAKAIRDWHTAADQSPK